MKILLGYEVGTGKEVHMENHHTVVTGMTQLSGKTTTLEALVHRGNVKAIAFLTKRGEGGFRGQLEIPPYFKEQRKGKLIDWQYVEAILEATMEERMAFNRPWIIKVCRGAHSLREVYDNIKQEQEDARGLSESVYTNLAAYFEIILPEISKYQFADTISLNTGFNVMNLIGVLDEMQQLIIESTLSYVLQKEKNTVVIIPEAHKFIPQGKKTPVKATALRLIREGAAIGNYLWIDTQETTSVDKAILKQCSNWIMGYQQERNEVANVRENIGKRKISEEDIMNLKIGHFIASLQQKIYRVYVLPAGVDEFLGLSVAKGDAHVSMVKDEMKRTPNDSTHSGKKYQDLREEIDQIPITDHKILPGGAGPLLSEMNTELDRLRGVENDFKEYQQNTEDQEQAYRNSIDALQEEKKGLEETVKAAVKANEKVTKDLTNLIGKHELLLHKHEAVMGAIKVVLEPIVKDMVPEASVVVDEKVIERIIDKKIRALPSKQRAKIETGETGIPWVDMWLPKLKTAADRKIVTLLAGKIGTPLTKTQIALALGYSERGGSFNSALSGLIRKYKLVIKEGDTYRIAEAPV